MRRTGLLSTIVPVFALLFAGRIPPASAYGDLQAAVGWRAWLEKSDTQNAATRWRQVLREQPNEPPSAVGLALLAEEAGDVARSLELYHAALLGGADLLARPGTLSGPDQTFGRLLVEYAAAKLFYLRQYRRDRNLFTHQTLERLEQAGGPPILAARYRWALARQVLEHGEDKQAEDVLQPLAFARDFLLLGPFDNQEEAGLHQRFPPEETLDLAGEYRGKARSVSWRPLAPPPRWGYVDLGAVTAPSSDATVYALTAVYAAQPAQSLFHLGHAGALKLWVGGRCLLVRDAYHAALPDQVSVPVDLPQGWNPVLLKVCSKGGDFGFYLRLGGDPGTVEWWNGAGTFPVMEPTAFEETGPAWRSGRDEVFAASEAMKAHERALACLFYASGRRALQNLDEHDHEDLECYRAAGALFPASSLFWRYRGIAETQVNAARLAYAKSIELDPKSVLARQFLIEDFVAGRTPALAEGPLEEAMRLNPEAPALWNLRGVVHRKRGAEPLCSASFRRASDLAPYHSDYRENWLESRRSVMSRERLIAEYRKAVTAFPADRSLRISLIELVLDRGYASEAEALIREGLRFDPYDKDLFAPAVNFYRAAGNLDRAEALTAEALRICPEDAALNRLMGLVLREQGRLDDARGFWAVALATRPQDTWLEEYRDYHSPETGDFYLPFRIEASEIPLPPEVSPLANSLVLLDQTVRKVHENGASSHVVHRVARVLTDAGSRDNQRDYIYYEPGREKVKIKRARVTREDGASFDAPPPREYSAVKGGGEGARVFGDYYVKVLEYPSVEKGVTIDLEYEIEEMADNLYADYFGDVFYVGDYDPTVLCEYVLVTPAAREFHFAAVGTDQQPETVLSANGQERIYRWRFGQLPVIKTEPEMPARSEVLPYVKVSTFDSWDKMARWYWDLIKDQFTMTAETRRRARQLLADHVERRRKADATFTEDSLTDLDRVRAVNRFVNTEVRYLGLEFGINGYKPHRVSEICHAQYGDCKDKATLAVAFLKELGVEGRIALLRTRDRGSIDFSLASLGLFNHAIVYLPDVDGRPFVLDGTAQFFGTTELPAMDQGVDLLVIGEGGSWEFVPSPVDPADKNGGVYRTTLDLRPDGSAEGLREASFKGLYNVSVRYAYENPAKIKDKLEQTLGQNFPGTTVDAIETSDLADPESDEFLRFQLRIPRFAEAAGNTLSFRPLLFPYQASRTHAYLESREHDLVLDDAPWFREREMTVHVPDGYTVSVLPQPATVETSFGRIEAACTLTESAVTCLTRITWNTIRVGVKDYAAFRAFCRRIDEVEEARVVLTRTGG